MEQCQPRFPGVVGNTWRSLCRAATQQSYTADELANTTVGGDDTQGHGVSVRVGDLRQHGRREIDCRLRNPIRRAPTLDRGATLSWAYAEVMNQRLDKLALTR